MKALKLLALLLILAALAANASAHTPFINSLGTWCAMSSDPTLCDQFTGDDIGCTDYCGTACTGFINITGSCVSSGGHYVCKCYGTFVP